MLVLALTKIKTDNYEVRIRNWEVTYIKSVVDVSI